MPPDNQLGPSGHLCDQPVIVQDSPTPPDNQLGLPSDSEIPPTQVQASPLLLGAERQEEPEQAIPHFESGKQDSREPNNNAPPLDDAGVLGQAKTPPSTLGSTSVPPEAPQSGEVEGMEAVGSPEQPPEYISPAAAKARLRRVCEPNSKGEYKVPKDIVDQFKDKESRSNLEKMFEKCGNNPDKGQGLTFLLSSWVHLPNQQKTVDAKFLPVLRKVPWVLMKSCIGKPCL